MHSNVIKHILTTHTAQQLVCFILSLLLFSPAYAVDHPFLSAQEIAWIQDHPAPIRVHNELDWRPFNFNEDNQPKGYSIDYMNLIAAKIGLEIEYVSGPSWNEFLDMMKDQSLDLMINIASTKERRTYLTFTEPYIITSTALYVDSSEYNIADLDDLAGKKIGFTEGFFFAEFIRKYYPEIEIVTFDSTLASFIGVDKGLIDAAMEVPVVAQRVLLESNLNTVKLGGVVSDPRFITTFSIATRKNELTLNSIIQKGMDAVSSTEELAIRQKWKIEEAELPLLKADDKSYLQQLGVLRLCVNPSNLPLEAVNLDGTLTGVSSEFVGLLTRRIGIPFNIVQIEDWQTTLELAERGECDLLPMVTNSKQVQPYLSFTSPWLSVPIAVATRPDQIYISSIEQIIDKEIGVVKGFPLINSLRHTYPGIKLTEVDNVREGLTSVSEGLVFGLIDTIPAISRTLQINAITGVKISGDIGLSMEYSVGIKKEDGQLLSILERALESIDKKQIAQIYNRWLSVAYIDRFDYTRFWQLLAVIVIATLYLSYRYWRGLQITAELRDAHAQVEAANDRLNKQARTDTLTGVANRLRIDEELRRELTRFERHKELFSVILLDLDYFKRVNDQYGHNTGDIVLKSIAATLSQNTRANDTLGRWGGEEFLVICPSTTRDGAMTLAETLRVAILNCTFDKSPPSTASFGIATIQDGDTANSLIKRADEALYRAKEKGRNRVEQSPSS